MVNLMNAIAQASAAPASGSKLDNRRVMAAIVDLLIVTAGAVVILVAADSLSEDRRGALAAVILGWALYYFFALESGEGQTLGKRLMRIRVMRADGRPAGMGEIAVRTILRVIDNYLVGLIVMLATGERRQRIGDLAAGTMVVDASGPAVMAPPAPAAEVLEPVEHEVESEWEVDEPELEYDEPELEYEEPEVESEPVEHPVATQTISLPARPAPPETLADLVEPEPEVEPVVEEAVVVEEPVEDVLPPAMSPALEELSEDVAAAHVEPEVAEVEDAEEPVSVRSVETVSAMDLIMGAAEEDAAGQDDSESHRDAEDPASA